MRLGGLGLTALAVGALLALAVPAVPGRAASSTRLKLADLHELCTNSDQGNKIACQFYIIGVTEGASTAADVAGDKSHFCIPADVSNDAMQSVVIKAMERDLAAFPADADLPAVNFVSAVMNHEYPCRKAN